MSYVPTAMQLIHITLSQVLLIGPLSPADWVIQGDMNVLLTGHWILQRTVKKSKFDTIIPYYILLTTYK